MLDDENKSEIAEISEFGSLSPITKRGRKTAYVKAILEPYIRKYFNRGISASSARLFIMEEEEIKEMNISISDRMIRNYYHGYAHQIHTEKSSDVFKREKEVKNRFILAIDSQLLELYKVSCDIESQLQPYRDRNVPITDKNGMYRLRMELTRKIIEVLKLKTEVELEPYLDEEMEKQIDEWVRKEKEKHQTGYRDWN